ncbi:MAG: filamentous hemagglutinin N-terminal domain-containing protein [Methylococcales bacterium]|nr:filamentous hemagglutinin N-terminal domain-containing protein [Methylococcales bacterium]
MNTTKVFVFLILSSAPIYAEIIIDGSLSGNGQQVTIPPKPVPNPTPPGTLNRYTIDDSLGKKDGSNLFHSFSTFNVYKGEQAYFTNSAEATHIFARVTGGELSTINGTISTKNPANLWLMNPAGWLIGKGAKLDVQGAFHLTSANGIGFGDGSMFFADPESNSKLSAAPPIDYQFNGSTQGTITLEGSEVLLPSDEAVLEMPEEKNITLLGGNITMKNFNLHAPGGRVVLASNSGVGKWKIENNGLTQVKGKGGIIDISHKNPKIIGSHFSISSSGDNSISDADRMFSSGGIQLTAKEINLTNASIAGEAWNNIPAANTVLHASKITLTKSLISTDAKGNQNAGVLKITGNDLNLDGSRIKSNTTSEEGLESGTGGKMHIDLQGNLELKNGSKITSIAIGNHGGDIDVNANNISINGISSINVATQSKNAGNAGDLTITTKQLLLTNDSSLNSSAELEGSNGNGGDIQITADKITLKHHSLISSDNAKNSSGHAGDIRIKTDNLFLIKDSEISADAKGSGTTGTIILNGNLTNNMGTLMLDHSKIITSAAEVGSGGNIKVDTKRLVMNGGFIQANAIGENSKGGEITLNAGVTLASQGKILDNNNDERQEFNPNSSVNVIQAVADKGINGPVTLNTDEINIAGQLAKIDSNFAVRQPISHDPCSIARNKQTSSLIQKGQGGLPSNAGNNIHLPLHRYRSKETEKPHAELTPANKKPSTHSTPDLCKKRKK